ncbi:PaaI family thioesterase [bacterium]|nr:MAG: PaaI family thioesterase [bacterium]
MRCLDMPMPTTILARRRLRRGVAFWLSSFWSGASHSIRTPSARAAATGGPCSPTRSRMRGASRMRSGCGAKGERMSEQPPIDDGRCFACGADNPIGLHLRFEPDGDDGVRTRLSISEQFQGWRGVLHGGIVMTLLDEAMAHAALRAGAAGLTASVSVRFRNPAPVGAQLELRGRVVERRRHVLSVESTLSDVAGTLLCQASGKFIDKSLP